MNSSAIRPENPYSPTNTTSTHLPASETRPFITGNPVSPVLPFFGPSISHARDHHEVHTEPLTPRPYYTLKPLSHQKAPFLDHSHEYSRDISNCDDQSERYHLVGPNRDRSLHRMDMEVQRLRDKDERLKRNIRRFRFVVRSVHLACRYVH